ncbi:pentapeptide repeat-containing protein [Methylomonas sp. EFPC1]|uniref:pentapeptide repeat-containing protein n=1 Tax=Methylomonas sp. EFPC1 TaxID=2812647 RepID=UPI0019675470|nr:pentapeptide repeat-containing protein [Methylomonas sp. EFPC1]QSB01050.1 pentapeptide repeat-containing protein [Methylomonas sp. EFPC1]
MDIQNDLTLLKPVSVWNRSLKIDPKSFLFKLAKAATKGFQGEFENAGENLAEALLDVKPEEKTGQLAWLLIYRSLTSAMTELLSDSRDLFPEQQQDDQILEGLTDNLNDYLLNLEVGISAEFFRYPQQLPLLAEFGKGMQQWLQGLGLAPMQARSLAQRLPDKFALALHGEWLKDAEHYSAIKTAIDTPFTHAAQKERQWLHYHAWLSEQFNQRMFAEAFGLHSVYVPLRAYYEERPKPEQDKASIDAERQKAKRHVVDLQHELEGWINDCQSDDHLRIISGGPGSGKSSFCKMFASHIAETVGVKVLFVPLHQFDLRSDLIESVANFVSQSRYLEGSPLHGKDGESRLLVIFDGLDELSMQGKAALQAAQDFVEEVIRKFDAFASQGLKRQVLISGRDLVVQANLPKIRAAKQVLQVLPYLVEKSEPDLYADPQELLASDQRQIWWAKYGEVSGKDYRDMPAALGGDNLADITRWPLLNYLVALSFDRKKLNFDSNTSLNLVYQDLLEAVYDRQYENRRIHQGAGGLEFANFRRILEEIALAVWHGDGRTTTVDYIQSRCKQSSLQRYLDEFQDGASKGVTRLLTAFYFRQSGEIKGDKTFEFTHKSFGEYLTACRLVRMLEKIQQELERHQKDPDDGWDARRALEHWAELCGPTAIDGYLHPFIHQQVALMDIAKVHDWQQTICRLIESLLRHGMPLEKMNLASFQQMLNQSRNAEESLLVMHAACAYQTQKLSDLDFPTKEAFGNWLHRLRGQRINEENTAALYSLGFLNLRSCVLHLQDMFGADLRGACLDGALLYLVNLQEASLHGANLHKAYLNKANLHKANLQGAYLQGANLQGANLQGANLQETNLEGAYLQGANLHGANLHGANLEGANLNGANLNGANLNGANLNGANLNRANLNGANLNGANLNGANLEGANLEGANLHGIDFARVNGIPRRG